MALQLMRRGILSRVVGKTGTLGNCWQIAPSRSTIPCRYYGAGPLVPSSHHSGGIGDEQQNATLMKVAFRIQNPEKLDKYLQDTACNQFLEIVHKFVKFQRTYNKMTYFVATSDILEGNLPPELQGVTLQQLGSQLSQGMHAWVAEWLSSMKAVQNLLLHGPDRLESLLDQMDGEPLEQAVVARTLQVKKLRKAIEVMTFLSENTRIVDAVKLFEDNVNQKNPKFADVCHLHKELRDKQEELALLEGSRQSVLQEIAGAKAALCRLNEQWTNLQCAKHGQGDHLKYLEKELEHVDLALVQARDDEKHYTRWMFGVWTPVWENDVKLATDKVNKFSDEKRRLETQIEAVKGGSYRAVKDLNQQLETIKGSEVEQEVLLKSKEQSLQSIIADSQTLRTSISDLTTTILEKLDAEGKRSFEHMMNANAALNAFKENLRHSASAMSTVSEEWTYHLDYLNDLSSQLVKANKKEDQVELVRKLRDAIQANKVPFLDFLGNAVLPTTLAVLDLDPCAPRDALANAIHVPRGSMAAPKQLEG